MLLRSWPGQGVVGKCAVWGVGVGVSANSKKLWDRWVLSRVQGWPGGALNPHRSTVNGSQMRAVAVVGAGAGGTNHL